jgi:hypothetical protein
MMFITIWQMDFESKRSAEALLGVGAIGGQDHAAMP